MQNETFQSGHTLTSFLKTFDFAPSVIDVISAGAYTLVQDLPGRPTVGKGVSILMGADRGRCLRRSLIIPPIAIRYLTLVCISPSFKRISST